MAAGLQLLPHEMVEKYSKASNAALVPKKRRLVAKKRRALAIQTAIIAKLGFVQRKDEGGKCGGEGGFLGEGVGDAGGGGLLVGWD